ncbi:MAG: hypothetical protein KME46_17075 [Brasilonema angustatum HA4187-MV1]|nr:hypothetical protein [Brasilonema angustatum HA4187-MV1]
MVRPVPLLSKLSVSPSFVLPKSIQRAIAGEVRAIKAIAQRADAPP